MFEEVSFPSEGATLRGRFYHHNTGHHPAVVMAHGTTGTVRMVIDAYAEAFFAAGFDVLLYDHKNFGTSGGEPRQEINPWIQTRGYRDAVAYLRESNPDKPIALWGDSYSAALALVAGALIENIVAIVSQIPVCGMVLPEGPADNEAFALMGAILANGDVSGGPEQTVGPIPVVSTDQINSPSLLAPIQAFRWFMEYGSRHGSGWENRVIRVIPDTAVPCSPFIAAPHLTMPVLFMVGRNDEMVHCNSEVQRAVFDRITSEKEFVEIEGGHFGLLWHPGPQFDEAVKKQTEFLTRVLRPD